MFWINSLNTPLVYAAAPGYLVPAAYYVVTPAHNEGSVIVVGKLSRPNFLTSLNFLHIVVRLTSSALEISFHVYPTPLKNSTMFTFKKTGGRPQRPVCWYVKLLSMPTAGRVHEGK